MIMKTGQELRAAGTKATLQPTHVIESFDGNWEKTWIFSRDGAWPTESWCFNDERVLIPQYGKIILDVKCENPNKLKVGVGDYVAGYYTAEFTLKGGMVSERIEIYPFDLRNTKGKDPLMDWKNLCNVQR
jgi:hypothetical protein